MDTSLLPLSGPTLGALRSAASPQRSLTATELHERMTAARPLLVPEIWTKAILDSLSSSSKILDMVDAQERRETLLKARRVLGVPVELYDRMDFAGIRFVRQAAITGSHQERWWMRLPTKDRVFHIDVFVPHTIVNDLPAWELLLAEAADQLSEYVRNQRAR